MSMNFEEIEQRMSAAEQAARDAKTPWERGFAAGLMAEVGTMLEDAIERYRVEIRDEQERLRGEIPHATPDYADLISQEISQLDHLHFQAGELFRARGK